MTKKRKIPIDPEEVLGAADTSAQEERDKELRDTGAVPSEVFHESPEEAEVVAESTAEQVLPEDILHLKKQCEEAQKCAEEEHENFLRAVADFNNYRRRVREELEQAGKFAIEDFIIRLLPILDDFSRAIKAAEETGEFDALHGGVILILRQLQDLLAKNGVQPIQAAGRQFDPTIHEAVMRVETAEYPDNTIVEEVQKGYMMGDKVIRPSMVKVARRPETAE